MKTTEDLRLEQAISEPILKLVTDAIDGKLDDVSNGDLQGITEVLAADLIQKVRQ